MPGSSHAWNCQSPGFAWYLSHLKLGFGQLQCRQNWLTHHLTPHNCSLGALLINSLGSLFLLLFPPSKILILHKSDYWPSWFQLWGYREMLGKTTSDTVESLQLHDLQTQPRSQWCLKILLVSLGKLPHSQASATVPDIQLLFQISSQQFPPALSKWSCLG